MTYMAVLEQEKVGLLKGSNGNGSGSSSSQQTDATLSDRIEALKELTMALLKEVEALGEIRSPGDERRRLSLQDEVRRFEMNIIRYALMRTSGSQRRAARMLGVKATTLNAKIKRYQINPAEVVEVATERDWKK